MSNILPTFPLPVRQKPFQKITVKKMPERLHAELSVRAEKMNKDFNEYCRIVLHHAMTYRPEYGGLMDNGMLNGKFSVGEINIPVEGKQFLEDLRQWDPFGDRNNSKIAVSLLTKHLNTRKW